MFTPQLQIFQYSEGDQEEIACQAALEATRLLDNPIRHTPPVEEESSTDNDELDNAKHVSKDGIKSYHCPRPGCSKIYKNRNGLKYHLQKGSCSVDYMTPLNSGTNSPMMEGKYLYDDITYIKPFYCKLCQKRYKNLNGLKYHGRADHPGVDFNDIRGKTDN